MWASVTKPANEVIGEAFSEAMLRDSERTKQWVALIDGNEPQLDELERLARVHEIDLTVILDIIHVLEYLWKAAFVFCDEGTKEAEQWVTERLLRIHYMRYDEYLAKGYPIATGVIEGACRHLVNDRMGITGARWGIDRAEAVLRLRSLKSSGHFDDYWEFHEQQEYRRTHAERYANEDPPRIAPASSTTGERAHLQIVK